MADTKRLGRVYVRVSKQEETLIKAEAAEMGLTMSDYLRHIITTHRALQTGHIQSEKTSDV